MTQQLPKTSTSLDNYFQRIGYHGNRDANLETLCAIHQHHTNTIAFENLSPLLKQPVHLDVPSLIHKLVHSGRGGYCFEHNLLLHHVLTTLGYQVTCLAARVRWNVPDEVTTARGHMLLRVDIDAEPYIVDAGFGGLTLTAPVRLALDVEQPTPHEPFRVVVVRNAYVLQAKVDYTWKALYSFDLQEQQIADYEVTNWYLSNHPHSHFVTSLIAARPDMRCRYTLRNNQFAVHHLNGPTERCVLATVDELRTTLEDTFQVSLPDAPDLEAALKRVVAQAH